MDVTPEEVLQEMSKHQVQTLIHGHTHRPNIHSLFVNEAPGKRIVLGDWDKTLWYIEIDGEIELKQGSLPSGN